MTLCISNQQVQCTIPLYTLQKGDSIVLPIQPYVCDMDMVMLCVILILSTFFPYHLLVAYVNTTHMQAYNVATKTNMLLHPLTSIFIYEFQTP